MLSCRTSSVALSHSCAASLQRTRAHRKNMPRYHTTMRVRGVFFFYDCALGLFVRGWCVLFRLVQDLRKADLRKWCTWYYFSGHAQCAVDFPRHRKRNRAPVCRIVRGCLPPFLLVCLTSSPSAHIVRLYRTYTGATCVCSVDYFPFFFFFLSTSRAKWTIRWFASIPYRA